jgi:predicted DNA-binding transcriptional regulator AlpA
MKMLPETVAEIVERLMNAQEIADYLNVTVPGLYLAVKLGRIPPPVYPLSPSPRWRKSEIDAALEQTRATPAQARAERRQARIERKQGQLAP